MPFFLKIMKDKCINFVNVSRNYDDMSDIIDYSDFLQKDPLAGTEEEIKIHRLNLKVFAEPTPVLDVKTPENVVEGEEICFFDNVTVQQIPGKRRKFHINIKDDRNPMCPQDNCKRTFSSRNLLKAHVRKVHCADRNKYQCGSCSSSFPLKYLLVRHLAIHSNKKKECPECHKMLSMRTSLSQHLKSHNKIRQYECSVCCKTFIRKATLECHMRYVHRTVELYCEECDVRFKKRIEYQVHQTERHVGERRLECELCGRMFSTLAALGAHRAKKHEVSTMKNEK